MGTKRPLEENTQTQTPKRKKKGFTVGPANLPDGPYRRKAQKIKSSLIAQAKLKKSYSKIKKAEAEDTSAGPHRYAPQPATTVGMPDHDLSKDSSLPEPAGLELHPDRQAMVDAPPPPSAVHIPRKPPVSRPPPFDPDSTPSRAAEQPRQARRPKQSNPNPYSASLALAEKRKAEAEKRRKDREAKDRERRMMAKAKRPDREGNRRLGRESKVLLSRVKRLVGGEGG